MPVSTEARLGGQQEFAAALAHHISAGLRVALPGIIQSFNPQAVTCVVQPAIRGKRSDDDGSERSVKLPLLVDVPVVFPRGGGCTLTFPVAAGDECLVIFADRCIDFWWQSGDVQEPVDPRMHDLSDAFALVGPMSQQRKISNISVSATQLRTDDGAAVIELAVGHDISLRTPGRLTASAQGGTVITSPSIILNGNVTINGSLTQGMGDNGGGATLRGPVNVQTDVKAAGISLVSHTHPGVQSGGSSTGKAQ
ncbi:Gp138 family membrane-puncturing spike protein [Cronobacter turicensis]|uniref:Gp138 family membrane-puncturing spike protein n=1 Tax=unclassified Cronobacter TaxID=2649764 RepID=UPI0013ECBF29|nr:MULTISPECIES: Gp138 family membrane-puncturing spike protein [unclassified Cronobacter]ELQ6225166.1 translation initiation factor IF-2 [Cronobacter turicensis]KAF6594602.1 translation initiation factor IF-2 [Cronobacter sp. EKM101R]KAF6596884.1 translation initiation factor IF-2 [Cronobacter sp. EKM102R]